MGIYVVDEGVKEYGIMLEKQRALFNEMVHSKKSGQAIEEELLILVVHPSVITLGRHAESTNILMPVASLLERGIEVFRIERGGDVTYHGPGQLVVYPLIDLEKHQLGVKDYVALLEETVISTISEYGIHGQRIVGASGVWIDAGTLYERKICAIGVKCSRFITMHGFALNVNTDLSGFETINPCGFKDRGVTSVATEIGHTIDLQDVKKKISYHFGRLLKTECVWRGKN